MPRDQIEANKAAIKRFVDAANAHDPQLLSQVVDDVVDPDLTARNPMPIEGTGAEGVKKVFAILHEAFPDLHISVEDLIAEGDKVVARERITGTHHGSYLGHPATGKQVDYNEITVSRFESGRIVEAWSVVDAISLMRQLGAVPTGPVK